MPSPSTGFEHILDDCVVAIQEQGQTVENCLARYPAHREELEPLLCLVARLESARTLKAPAALRQLPRSSIEAQQAEAEQAPDDPHPLRDAVQKVRFIFRWPGDLRGGQPSWFLRRRRATIMIGALIAVLMLAGAGTVHASADALPGHALYPVKTTVEDVRLAVSISDAEDARLRLEFAARRLDEVIALMEEGEAQDVGQTPAEYVEQALADYAVQVERALDSFREDTTLSTDDQALLASLLVQSLPGHRAKLAVLLAPVLAADQPATARPGVALAVSAYEQARAHALDVATGADGEIIESLPALPQPPSPDLPPQPPTPVPLPQLPTPAPSLPPSTAVPTPRPPTSVPSLHPPTATPLPQPPAAVPSPQLSTAVASPQSPTPTPSLQRPTSIPSPQPPTSVPSPQPPTSAPSPQPPTLAPSRQPPTSVPSPQPPTPIPSLEWPDWPTLPVVPTPPDWPTPPKVPVPPGWPTPPAWPTPPEE